HRAASLPRLEPDLSPVAFDDLPRDGEAQAGAARLARGKERLEGATGLLFREALAAVGDFDHVTPRPAFEQCGDDSAVGRSVAGVDQKIDDNLLEFPGVSLRDPRLAGALNLHADLTRGDRRLTRFDRVDQDAREVDLRMGSVASARELQEVPHESRRSE